MRWMFAYCNKLKKLKFMELNMNNVKDVTNMFYYCNKLSSITATQETKDQIDSLYGNIESNPQWTIVNK